MFATIRRLGALCLLMLLPAGCGKDECPAGTRPLDGRCVVGDVDAGEGEGEQAVACGNGVLEDGEECDDGEGNSDVEGDACRTSCVRAACGDGVVDSRESCDEGDGNADDGSSACRTTCALASCGDGRVDAGEQCDDGADNNDVAPGACRTTCVAAFCGDGVVDADETCDAPEGNSDAVADACRTACVPASCGDGVVDTGEACDTGSGSCAALVLYGDADGDGYGDDATRFEACEPGEGSVDRGGDCDDGAPGVSPGVSETCNGVDDDCANGPDDGFECVEGTSRSCDTPCGTVGTQTCSGCAWSACQPPEDVCNYVDDDCDGLVDPDLQGLVGDPVQITDNATISHTPSIAWAGDRYVVAFFDTNAGEDEAFVATVEPGGRVLLAATPVSGAIVTPLDVDVAVAPGAAPTLVTLDGSGTNSEPFARSFDLETGEADDSFETNFGAGWDGRQLDLTATAGGLVGVAEKYLSTQTRYSVAFDTYAASGENVGGGLDQTFARIPDADYDEESGEIVAAFLATGTGDVEVTRRDEAADEVLAPTAVTATGGLVQNLAMAAGDDGALVAYTRADTMHVWVVPVDSALQPGAAVELADVHTITRDAVASSGNDYLVGLGAMHFGGAFSDAALVRVSPSGALSGTAVAIEASLYAPLRVVWTGSGWGVVYVSTVGGDSEIFLQEYGCP